MMSTQLSWQLVNIIFTHVWNGGLICDMLLCVFTLVYKQMLYSVEGGRTCVALSCVQLFSPVKPLAHTTSKMAK